MEQQKKTKIAGGLADPEEFVEEFGGKGAWREGLEREARGPEEIEYEEEQQYEEPQEEQQYEEEEPQQEQQYEHEHELNGVEGGVADLHLGAEQPAEEEEHYVPHEAQEGLRKSLSLSLLSFARVRRS